MQVRRHSRNVNICTKSLKKIRFFYDTSNQLVSMTYLTWELGSMKFSSTHFFLSLATDIHFVFNRFSP